MSDNPIVFRGIAMNVGKSQLERARALGPHCRLECYWWERTGEWCLEIRHARAEPGDVIYGYHKAVTIAIERALHDAEISNWASPEPPPPPSFGRGGVRGLR